MKKTFAVMSVILAVAGLVFPVLWIAAAVAGLIAMSAAPEGRRIDGKRKTGGLFGGLIDDIALAGKTDLCPHCRTRVLKSASKCANCGEWIGKKTVA